MVESFVGAVTRKVKSWTVTSETDTIQLLVQMEQPSLYESQSGGLWSSPASDTCGLGFLLISSGSSVCHEH